MHANEIKINLKIVRGLIQDQFPELATLPVTPVNSTGTVNAIYKLGENLAIRLPRVIEWSHSIEKEWKWLSLLARQVTLKIPEPFAFGQPNDLYPVNWSIYKWIDGEVYSDELISDEREAVSDLANFVAELHSIKVACDAPKTGRLPLRELNEKTIVAIKEAGNLIDKDKALIAWEHACRSPVWNSHPVWIHADLLRTNLLVDSGSLKAVIDFGSTGIGDPAFDFVPAWSVFYEEGRTLFRDLLKVDTDTWGRARGYALHQAALIIPYYTKTNPQFVAQAIRTIEQVLFDID